MVEPVAEELCSLAACQERYQTVMVAVEQVIHVAEWFVDGLQGDQIDKNSSSVNAHAVQPALKC